MIEMGMDFVVVGCGPLGRLIAAASAAAGLQVSMICLGYSRIQGNRIRLAHNSGEQIARLSHVTYLNAPIRAKAAVIAVRAQQLEEVMGKVKADVALLTQPSLVARDILEEYRNVGILAFYGCSWMDRSRDLVEFEAAGASIALPYSNKSSELVAKISEGLEIIGVRSSLIDSRRRLSLLWDYVASQCSVQPVATVLGTSYGRLARSRHGISLVESLAREILLIMDEERVEKLRSPVDAAYQLMNVKGCRPKMLRDLEERVNTEIDYMTGMIIREALRAGLYAPYNDALYLQVKTLEEIMLG